MKEKMRRIVEFIKQLFVSPISKLNSNDPIVIVDIGCRWGFAERFIRNGSRGSNFKIYGFDPDEDECVRLKEKYQQLPNQLVNLEPVALGQYEGKRELYVTQEPACSSFYKPIKLLTDRYPTLSSMGIEKKVMVAVTTLYNWAKKNEVKSLDYIKLDTQGAELEILKGANSLIKTTRCIDIEVIFNPLYEGQSLFCDIDKFLRAQGFVLWKFTNLVHYSLDGEQVELNQPLELYYDRNVRQEHEAFGGQVFWGDATYVHQTILNTSLDSRNEFQYERDMALFETLEMLDVIQHMRALSS